MKRKVIQIAESTQLISLPRKWCKEMGLKKGDELEVLEDTDKIIITTGNNARIPENYTVSIDISGIGSQSKRIIGALYRAGYDEIHVKYSTQEELTHIYDLLRDGCIGFEIVEQGGNFVVIKKVSDALPEEFESILRRCFLHTITLSKECFDVCKNPDVKALAKVRMLDHTINKFVDFCERVMTKRFAPRNIPLYHIIEIVEHAADNFKELAIYSTRKKLRLQKELLEAFQQSVSFLEHAYELYYKFDVGKLKSFYQRRAELQQLLDRIEKRTDKDGVKMVTLLSVIIDDLWHLDSSLMEVHMRPEEKVQFLGPVKTREISS